MFRVLIVFGWLCWVGVAGSAHASDTLQLETNWSGWKLDTVTSWHSGAPYSATIREQQAAQQGSAYYAQLVLINPQTNVQPAGVYIMGRGEYLSVCLSRGVDTCLYNGSYQPRRCRVLLTDYSLLPILVPARDTVRITITVANLTRTAGPPTGFLVNERAYLTYLADDRTIDKRGLALSLGFLGSALVLMLYTMFLYFQNQKERLYLYYSGYLFFAMWYFAQKVAVSGPFFVLYPNFPLLGFILNEPLQFGLFICYNAFVVSILKIPRHAPRLARIIRNVNWGYLLYALVDLLYMSVSLDGDTRDLYFVVARGVVILISIYLMVYIWRTIKSPLVPYIIGGSMLFLLFSSAAMIFSLWPGLMGLIQLYAINFMHIGIFLEALFFSMAMGYRIRLNTLERQGYYRAYVDQLRRNHQLVEATNRELNQKVEARTAEIVAQTQALEAAKADQLRIEYERKVLESDLNTLRLQMNPHFIFNSLNSIRYYILKQDATRAAEFIADFARLLRMVLHHSKQKLIRFSEEIDALDLYLSFEQERLSNQFTYTIDIDPSLRMRELALPPLLIQPFAENAVWHGLSPLQDRKGTLAITVDHGADDRIQIDIVDNGIGRKAAEKLSKQERKSYGLEITSARMEAVNKLEGIQQSFTIMDLYDATGRPAGTKVTLLVKKINYLSVND